QDGGEVVLAEAFGLSGEDQRLVDALAAAESGQLDRPAHLGPDSTDATGSGGAQPAFGTGPDVDKSLLGGGARAELGLLDAAAVGMVGVVLFQDAGPAGCGKLVTDDLDQEAASVATDNDHLLALDADPHLLSDVTGRGRVGHVTQPHGLVLPDRPGLAQRSGVGSGGSVCRCWRSSASISSGGRLVARCGR